MQATLKNIAITLSFSSMLLLGGCATSDLKEMVSTGNATATSNEKLKPISPSKVVVYDESPKHYKVVGRISSDNYSMVGMTRSQESVMKELRKQAASIGANGVIKIHQGMTQTTAVAVLVSC